MTHFSNVILPITLAHEGGKVDHPRDPGGRTNKGIIQRTYDRYRSKIGKAVRDVFQISDVEVAAIYTTEYWNKIKGSKLPRGVDLATFDGAVNSGPSRGVKWLQGAIGVARDGKVGPKTIKAAKEGNAASMVVAMCALRMGFLQRLRHWSTFKRGWTRRVASIEAKGVSMATVGLKSRLKEEGKKAVNKKVANDAGAVGSGAVGGGGLLAQSSDFPEWMIAAIAVVLVAAAAMFIIQRWRHKDRAEAYAAELKRLEKK